MTTYNHKTIKTLSLSLRPRERLQKYGADYIELNELIAIIIRSGTRDANALQIAQNVVDYLEKINFSTITLAGLTTIDGISAIKATEIIAAVELGARIASLRSASHSSIQESEDCLPYLRDIRTAKKEHFVALYLDTKNVVIDKEIISIGILDASLVHPREVFEPAYRLSCARVILAHNHPSGDPTPSPEDISITRLLIEAGTLLGIQVLDHIIVGKLKHTALKESHSYLFE